MSRINSTTESLDSATGLPVGDKSTDNAKHVRQVASDVLPPENVTLQGSGSVAASATDNVLIYSSVDVSAYNYHVFENLAATDPIDLYVSLDGTNYSTAAAAVELLDDVTTGGGVKVIDIPVNKIGVLRGKFANIKVLRKGTTNEAQSIRYLHGVV